MAPLEHLTFDEILGRYGRIKALTQFEDTLILAKSGNCVLEIPY